MPRAKAVLQSEFPYNITARCINKEWFQLPMNTVWKIFCEELLKTHKDHCLEIHSFVLMSNHFHLIATTPLSDISKCMHQFMGRSSRRLTREGNRINQTFAGRHYKCILQHQNYFLNAYKYNYRNPVTAGLVQRVENYPFSTLHENFENSDFQFPISKAYLFSSNRTEILEWLNLTPDSEKFEAVRQGLKHQFFKSKKCLKNNRVLIEDSDIL